MLVGQREILTSAHMVNDALGRHLGAQGPPPSFSELRVGFPFLSRTTSPCRAWISRWMPPSRPGAAGDDIAGLVLEDNPPDSAVPARLRMEPTRVGEELHVFGFRRQETQADALHTVAGDTPVIVLERGDGRMHLGSPSRTLTQAPADALPVDFSGSPVVDIGLGRIVGMVWANSFFGPGQSMLALDAERLRRAWPESCSRCPTWAWWSPG